MGSSSGTQTTTQTAQPWGPLAGASQFGIQQAGGLYNAGPTTYFPGQTYASRDPYTNQAYGMVADRATGGSPVTQAGGALATNTLQGNYLNQNPAFQNLAETASGGMLGGNPHIDAVYNRAAEQVSDGVNSQFVGAGRTGSGYHAKMMGDSLGDMASDMYFQNYAQERANQLSANNMLSNAYSGERGRQMQALGMSPQLAAADYQDAYQLAELGAGNEAFAQQGINEQIARHDYGQNAQIDLLNRYLAQISGAPGGQTQTTVQPTYSNPLGSATGGALAGYQLSGGNPYGALVGGGLGYLSTL